LGKRWRRCPRDFAACPHFIKTSSERGQLHRVFDTEYAHRGHAVGKERVLGDQKANYPEEESLKAVLVVRTCQYPVEKGAES